MNGTHFIGTAWIDGRRLQFDAIVCQARLRITMSGAGDEFPATAAERTEAEGHAAAGEGAGYRTVAGSGTKTGAGSVPTEFEALGSVIGLDTVAPGLRVCAPLHVEWAARNSQAIVDEAKAIWAAVLRECDG